MDYNKIQIYKTSLPGFSSLEGRIIASLNVKNGSSEEHIGNLEIIEDTEGEIVLKTPNFLLHLDPLTYTKNGYGETESSKNDFIRYIFDGTLCNLDDVSIIITEVENNTSITSIKSLNTSINTALLKTNSTYAVSGTIGTFKDVKSEFDRFPNTLSIEFETTFTFTGGTPIIDVYCQISRNYRMFVSKEPSSCYYNYDRTELETGISHGLVNQDSFNPLGMYYYLIINVNNPSYRDEKYETSCGQIIYFHTLYDASYIVATGSITPSKYKIGFFGVIQD